MDRVEGGGGNRTKSEEGRDRRESRESMRRQQGGEEGGQERGRMQLLSGTPSQGKLVCVLFNFFEKIVLLSVALRSLDNIKKRRLKNVNQGIAQGSKEWECQYQPAKFKE